jgi:ferredoxin-NADP reductase
MPQKLCCHVTEVLDHGEHVYSVLLRPESRAPRFLAGQFLHLALDPYKTGDFWPDSRTFSIASPPTEREQLRITYAVKGRFTKRMEAELRPGREVWVKLPYGDFTVRAGADVCLLAGGTGVTAFTAFLSGLAPEHAFPIYLVYGARRPDLLIYRALIESVVARCPNLHAQYLVEEGQDSGCISGRINLDQVWQWVPEPLAKVYYVSGPPIMRTALSAELATRGVPGSQILTDAWE